MTTVRRSISGFAALLVAVGAVACSVAPVEGEELEFESLDPSVSPLGSSGGGSSGGTCSNEPKSGSGGADGLRATTCWRLAVTMIEVTLWNVYLGNAAAKDADFTSFCDATFPSSILIAILKRMAYALENQRLFALGDATKRDVPRLLMSATPRRECIAGAWSHFHPIWSGNGSGNSLLLEYAIAVFNGAVAETPASDLKTLLQSRYWLFNYTGRLDPFVQTFNPPRYVAEIWIDPSSVKTNLGAPTRTTASQLGTLVEANGNLAGPWPVVEGMPVGSGSLTPGGVRYTAFTRSATWGPALSGSVNNAPCTYVTYAIAQTVRLGKLDRPNNPAGAPGSQMRCLEQQ